MDRRELLKAVSILTAVAGTDPAAAHVLEAIGAVHKLKERELHQRRGYYDKNGVRQGGLISFVRYFWDVLEPVSPFTDGWPLWALCEHLEAVSFGEVKRILINVPPGFMKSMLVNVFWPAWEWGALEKTALRYITFSYSEKLTVRDNGKFRDLLESVKFRKMYGGVVRLRNKTTNEVMNDNTGRKLASSIGGTGTGLRADRLLIDDPHNVIDGESELERGNAVRWFRESLLDRVNNMDTAFVVIMQRVHEDDVSGTILSLPEICFEHLMIPMEYDVTRQVNVDGTPVKTSIGWYDPRYDADENADGTLAWPERFTPEWVTQTQFGKGPYAWASQYQQSPTPRGGGLFERGWWQLWEDNKNFPRVGFVLASLDGAFTEKEENDPSALTVWGAFQYCTTCKKPIDDSPVEGSSRDVCDCGSIRRNTTQRFVLMDAWRKWLKFSADKDAIERMPGEGYSLWYRRTNKDWGLLEWCAHTCRTRKVNQLLIEAKGPGISAAQELRNRYGREGWGVREMPVKGDKVARALAAQPTFSQGMCFAPARDWAELVITEMSMFPKGKHDDLTDSAVQAINFLRQTGMARTDEEIFDEKFLAVKYRKKQKAIYPI